MATWKSNDRSYFLALNTFRCSNKNSLKVHLILTRTTGTRSIREYNHKKLEQLLPRAPSSVVRNDSRPTADYFISCETFASSSMAFPIYWLLGRTRGVVIFCTLFLLVSLLVPSNMRFVVWEKGVRTYKKRRDEIRFNFSDFVSGLYI